MLLPIVSFTLITILTYPKGHAQTDDENWEDVEKFIKSRDTDTSETYREKSSFMMDLSELRKLTKRAEQTVQVRTDIVPPALNAVAYLEHVVRGNTTFSRKCGRKYPDAHIRGKYYPHIKGKRVFVSGIIKDVEPIWEDWSNALRVGLANIKLAGGDVFVSLLENDSADRTPELLTSLAGTLDRMQVQYKILTGVDDFEFRAPHRIVHLATIRNRAMKPFWEMEEGKFDYLAMVSDYVWCGQDMLHLLSLASLGADLACPVDLFWDNVLYDSWVFRYIDGLPHPRSTPMNQTVWRSKGAFQVYCCWQGNPVYRAEHFYNSKLDFHDGWGTNAERSGNCSEAETALICDDLWKVGAQRIVIDPQITVKVVPEIKDSEMSWETPDPAIPSDWKAPPATRECIPLNSVHSAVPDDWWEPYS